MFHTYMWIYKINVFWPVSNTMPYYLNKMSWVDKLCLSPLLVYLLYTSQTKFICGYMGVIRLVGQSFFGWVMDLVFRGVARVILM